MDTLWQDVRNGLRNLLRYRGYSVVVLLTLALGIGANTAIFSVVNGVLLRPLPYPDRNRLVMIWERAPHDPQIHNVISPANFLDWRAQNHVFQSMSALGWAISTLTGQGEPESLRGRDVSAPFFDMLGAHAALGRTFTEEDDRPGAPSVAVISHSLWKRRFGGDPAVIGRTITLDDKPFTVIGVMPADFRFLSEGGDFWTPIQLDPAKDYRAKLGRYMRAIGELKPGVSLAQAQNEMDAIAARLSTQYPDSDKDWGVSLVSFHDQMTATVRPALLLLLAAVGFVLLIACANVANVALTRASHRRREMAIRAALGAAGSRLARQLITESVLLALIGGAAGAALASGGVSLLLALAPQDIPRLASVSVDSTALAFTFLLSLVTGVLFGLAPAWFVRRTDPEQVLRQGGERIEGGGHLLRDAFVIAQVALSLVLLAGAGLLAESFLRMQGTATGFDPSGLLTTRLDLPSARYAKPESKIAFFTGVVRKVSALPGVESASGVVFLPFSGMLAATDFTIAGRPAPAPGEAPITNVVVAMPGYFSTMRIPLKKGRLFDEGDTAQAPRVFLVNQSFVSKFFPHENPLGHHITVTMGDNIPGEIVGVVSDVKQTALDESEKPTVYYTYSHLPIGFMTLVVRSGAPRRQLPAVTAAIHSLDPQLPLADVTTMDELISDSVSQQRFQSLLLAIFACAALLLAAVGLYGVQSYAVVQRTREIGIRVALGADRSRIFRETVGRGAILVAIGLLFGLAAAAGLSRFLSSFLYQVSPGDPLTFAGVAVLLTAVSLLASYVPARRAMRVDPLVALRHE